MVRRAGAEWPCDPVPANRMKESLPGGVWEGSALPAEGGCTEGLEGRRDELVRSSCPKHGWMPGAAAFHYHEADDEHRKASEHAKGADRNEEKALGPSRHHRATCDVQRPAQGAGSALWFKPLFSSNLLFTAECVVTDTGL